MKKILPVLGAIVLFFSACKKTMQDKNIIQGLNTVPPRVTVENGHLSFRTAATYEAFIEDGSHQNFVKGLPGGNDFTSFSDKNKLMSSQPSRVINNCDVPDELIENNPVFFGMINEEGIVEIEGTLYRYDYCNEKVWVISVGDSHNAEYYASFMNGIEIPGKVGWFFTYVDAIEAVAQGYKTMPEETTVSGIELFEKVTVGARAVEYFYIKNDPKQPNKENVLMDGNLQYDKFAVYFHFYGKEKYRTPCMFNWCTSSGGNREWKVSFSYTYHRKGQNNPQSGSATIIPPSSGDNKADKTFYEGSRGLRKDLNSARWNVNNVYTRSVRVLRGENPGGLFLVGSYSIPTYQYKNNYQFPGSIDKPYVIRF